VGSYEYDWCWSCKVCRPCGGYGGRCVIYVIRNCPSYLYLEQLVILYMYCCTFVHIDKYEGTFVQRCTFESTFVLFSKVLSYESTKVRYSIIFSKVRKYKVLRTKVLPYFVPYVVRKYFRKYFRTSGRAGTEYVTMYTYVALHTKSTRTSGNRILLILSKVHM
jgi:hypothetical protein